MKYLLRIILLLSLLPVLSGCEQLGSTEYAVRFWKLPGPLGGVSGRIYQPGETIIDVPIVTKLYRLDAAVKDISWGASGAGSQPGVADYVQSRALDGNEVALSVTVSYKLTPDPEKLAHVLQRVGTSNEDIEKLVVAAARSDIRTYMNELKTSQFIEKEARYKAVDKVRDTLHDRLAPFGIEIHRVILDDFEFRRVRPDGTFDLSYEERLKEIQQREEEIEREKARIDTVRSKKEQEFSAMQAKVNQVVEEAKGFKNQAESRGNAYLRAKKNDAEAILATGQAHAKGLTEQIEALSGPGGKAILKLELAKQLIENDPTFVVLDSQGSDGIDVKRIDTNALLEQIGVLEGLREKPAAARVESEAAPKILSEEPLREVK